MLSAFLPFILPFSSMLSVLSVRSPVPVLTSLPAAVFNSFDARLRLLLFVLIFAEPSRFILPLVSPERIVVGSTKFSVPPTFTSPDTSFLPR